jgi:hypothetical protein
MDIKIVRHVENPTTEQIDKVLKEVTYVFIPKELDQSKETVSDYWLFFKDHVRCVYFGTQETFDKWQREQEN